MAHGQRADKQRNTETQRVHLTPREVFRRDSYTFRYAVVESLPVNASVGVMIGGSVSEAVVYRAKQCFWLSASENPKGEPRNSSICCGCAITDVVLSLFS